MQRIHTPAAILLRVAIAFAFIYPPISAFIDPFAWIGFFPPFLLDAFAGNTQVLLHAFGVLEVTLGLWILSGWRIHIPAALAALVLLAITALNWQSLDIVFRDLSLALAAAALAWMTWPRKDTAGTAHT